MAEANQNRVTKILFPLQNNEHQSVSLQKFKPPNLKDTELSESRLDLTLGLSLGGWYSQNPEKMPLIRSTSLTRVSNLNESDGRFLPLLRSSSLPTETGQEQRRRLKELHKMRRLEAARRLMEKQRKRRGVPKDEELPPRPDSPTQLVTWAQQSVARNPALRRALQIIKADADRKKNRGSGNSTANNCSQKFWPVTTSEEMPKRKPVKPAVAVITSGTMENGIPSKPAETKHGSTSKHIKWTTSGTIANGIPSKPAETEHGNPSKQIKRTTSRTMAYGIPSKPAETEHGNPSKKIKQTTTGSMANGIPSMPAETEHGNLSKEIKRTASRRMANGIPSNPTETEHDNPTKNIKQTTSGTMANGKPSKPAGTKHGNLSKEIKRTASRRMAKGIPFKPAETEHGNPSKNIKQTTSGTMANGKASKPAETVHSEPSKKNKPPCSKGTRDDGVGAIMMQMPSVTTTGDGPNGRTIQGFLYRYVKEQVNIICNCHAKSHSPAEFFKHAGGSDTVNPMKHINVLPSFS